MGKIALAVIVSLWVIPISVLLNHIVPEPYMVSKSFPKFGKWTFVITDIYECFEEICLSFNMFVVLDLQDEIFHIPQAQKYCKGNFGSWDPMITTPPGLYVLITQML